MSKEGRAKVGGGVSSGGMFWNFAEFIPTLIFTALHALEATGDKTKTAGDMLIAKKRV